MERSGSTVLARTETLQGEKSDSSPISKYDQSSC